MDRLEEFLKHVYHNCSIIFFHIQPILVSFADFQHMKNQKKKKIYIPEKEKVLIRIAT